MFAFLYWESKFSWYELYDLGPQQLEVPTTSSGSFFRGTRVNIFWNFSYLLLRACHKWQHKVLYETFEKERSFLEPSQGFRSPSMMISFGIWLSTPSHGSPTNLVTRLVNYIEHDMQNKSGNKAGKLAGMCPALINAAIRLPLRAANQATQQLFRKQRLLADAASITNLVCYPLKTADHRWIASFSVRSLPTSVLHVHASAAATVVDNSVTDVGLRREFQRISRLQEERSHWTGLCATTFLVRFLRRSFGT